MTRGAASTEPEVVILGAGLAGMTAAHELRRRDILVLDKLDRVGGRTLSGRHGEYWYNLGAQFVWDRRTLSLCEELGVEVLDAGGAHAGAVVRGTLVEAATPVGLFQKMPLSLHERWDLGRTVMRLNRLARRMPALDRSKIDGGSLLDLMGNVQPITRQVFDAVSESGCGLGSDEVSGWIGLGYSTHLFGGDVNGTLKQVVGGTQAISQAVAGHIDPERLLLQCRVDRVDVGESGVEIRFRQGDREEVLRPEVCVVALPASVVLEVVYGLPEEKVSALKRIGQYAPVVATAWLTEEDRPMPWDRLLAVPVIGDHSFDQLSNNGYFIRRRQAGRHRGGTLVTLSTCARGAALMDLDDGAIRRRVGADLKSLFPTAAAVLDAAEVKVQRWAALVPFRTGFLSDQPAVRAPVGRLLFCGDYTAQPGTPGAVGSGHYAAQAALEILNAA